MPAPSEVLALVDKFTQDASRFRDPNYNETQVRIEFIDPLFKALGWDVANSLQVVHEDRVSVVDGERKKVKHPDYGFRIGRDVKFYVEAKKPAVDLQHHPDPAYQVRRYGWSKGLKVSVLTDFEEFIIYNCAEQPDRKDKAHQARIKYIKYTEFDERWDEIADLLSFEAVENGAIEKFAQEELPKGTVTVDEAFLREMEQWRTLLAKDIALHNPNLTRRELNIAVQRTIDRIVFLRICEDRNIEPYARLYSNANERNGVYDRLKAIYAEAHDKYNSGLFDFDSDGDTVSLNIHISDDPLQKIIKRLYYPNSPYEFSVLPSDILGQVYERFLGKVIELDKNGSAEIVEKPEVRKAGGVYYTPTYIVDYIVENTVGKLVEGKTPNAVATLRVLDPACGSGSFLIGAYQYLMDWHLAYYSEKASVTALRDKKIRETGNPQTPYALTTDEKKRILTNNIYGVDLDQQAVEVSKLSLLLKMLEDETDSTARQTTMFATGERILPDLGDNIKWGNSLIGSDFYSGKQLGMFDDEEIYRVKAFDWDTQFADIMRDGGFDAVIGNPPYVRMEEFKDIKPYLRDKYSIHADRMDLYGYFIEKEHQLLRDSGLFGMIVSNKFIKARYGKGLRRYLSENANLIQIFDLAGLPVFSGATVRTVIILSTKGLNRGKLDYVPTMALEKFRSIEGKSQLMSQIHENSSYQIGIKQITGEDWNFARPNVYGLLERLSTSTQSLLDYISPLPVCMGVKSGLTSAFVIDEQTKEAIIENNLEASEIIKPLLNGRDVRRYKINYSNNYLIYTYHGVDIAKYPSVENYLRAFKGKLEKRATKQEWYELQQPQYRFAEYMDNPKIIFPDIGTTTRFSLDKTGFYGTNTTYFIPSDDLYLLGILNSKLSQFYFTQVCAGLEGTGDTYLRFFGQYLEKVPVANPDDKAKHDRMVALVQTMLDLHKQLPELSGQAKKVVQQQIAQTDHDIDALVYQLYDLTAEEIAIVEG